MPAPVALELPADCAAAILDVPLLPDATELVRGPEFVSYVTASTPAEVLAFYQQELPPAGWVPDGDADVSDTAATLDFIREGQLLSLIITAGEGSTQVCLVVVPAQAE